ncbi:uncharacterized protein K460DRAFT_117207 [Cucurbitaria berberidis CBS 394.84]|uniref:Uncharacterized protein n=1 Tax=Cucurbitaria berberidis CBS 394.84 TaxID=1168544 RepID=A0A9P4GIM8_9PLEO|nr:uncharacterized protein K460DRAFT_117207 [Cucurbitaria berberidis CBS 394.84]KAF1845919.1 hypothetical protein K460DRAFT_117207 [Cucurbitaria berberidis CBS 394.84]
MVDYRTSSHTDATAPLHPPRALTSSTTATAMAMPRHAATLHRSMPRWAATTSKSLQKAKHHKPEKLLLGPPILLENCDGARQDEHPAGSGGAAPAIITSSTTKLIHAAFGTTRSRRDALNGDRILLSPACTSPAPLRNRVASIIDNHRPSSSLKSARQRERPRPLCGYRCSLTRACIPTSIFTEPQPTTWPSA